MPRRHKKHKHFLDHEEHEEHEEGGVKYEARNPKSETISNYRNSNVQSKNLAMKRYKMHKRDKKMTKKLLYKHINSAVLQVAEAGCIFWVPAKLGPCLKHTGMRGLKKSIFFLKMRKQTGIVRIAITLSEGGKVEKNAVVSYKIRKTSRKGIGAHSVHRQPH